MARIAIQTSNEDGYISNISSSKAATANGVTNFALTTNPDPEVFSYRSYFFFDTSSLASVSIKSVSFVYEVTSHIHAVNGTVQGWIDSGGAGTTLDIGDWDVINDRKFLELTDVQAIGVKTVPLLASDLNLSGTTNIMFLTTTVSGTMTYYVAAKENSILVPTLIIETFNVANPIRF